MIISRSSPLRVKNVSDEIYKENHNTQFMLNDPLSENSAIYEIMRKKYCRIGQATDDDMIRFMHFACCITKAIDTHAKHIILSALPRQQSLLDRVSVIALYLSCLSCCMTLHD
jgi:hypothetical protein